MRCIASELENDKKGDLKLMPRQRDLLVLLNITVVVHMKCPGFDGLPAQSCTFWFVIVREIGRVEYKE